MKRIICSGSNTIMGNGFGKTAPPAALGLLMIMFLIFLSGCQPASVHANLPAGQPTQAAGSDAAQPLAEGGNQGGADQLAVLPAPTSTKASKQLAVVTPTAANRAGSTANTPVDPTTTAGAAAAAQLSPDGWQSWPVLPAVPAELKSVYLRGLSQGNDPHAFSILGDCQSQPDVFMGILDRDPNYVRTLRGPLQETVANFAGSFDRYSPTVKDATTEGALLWIQWNDNKEKKCTNSETPLDCELRVHRPSIVFVHIGTHWEARNRQYLDTIIHKILDRGAVPVLVTKADNREKDARVNHNLALLSSEYHLPLWNFWASVQHLPDNGLKPNSDMYLSDEAMEIHRLGALQALDAVWRGLK